MEEERRRRLQRGEIEQDDVVAEVTQFFNNRFDMLVVTTADDNGRLNQRLTVIDSATRLSSS